VDHAADTPLCPAAREAMLPALTEHWGSASSVHGMGAQARAWIDRAREHVASMAGCEPDEVYFTSGATEALNWAVKVVGLGEAGAPRGIVSSLIEHEATLGACRWCAERGAPVTWMPVGADGRARPAEVDVRLSGGIGLVALMAANNETGCTQPVDDAVRLARDAGALLLVDAVQSAPWGLAPFRGSGIDLVALSAHKFNGPQGVGALLIRRGTKFASWMHGGGQEQGLRAGTPNTASVMGMGAAAGQVVARRGMAGAVACLRDRLQASLLARVDGVLVTAGDAPRLPGHLHVLVRGVEGEAVVMGLSQQGVCASAGAACSSGTVEVSHVLRAMGVPDELGRGAVRFSLGPETTADDVDRTVGVMTDVVAELRALGGRVPG
jgi:cysteine desulfurase